MPYLIQSTLLASTSSIDFVTLLGTTQDDHSLRAILLMFVVVIVSYPMIVVHELGHLIAGRLMGIRIIEFNIGSGKILWERKILGIHFILRCIPVAGYVCHLTSESTTRLSQFVFIVGGPMANLLLAGVASWFSGESLADFFTQPSFIAILIAANLLLGLESLIPLADRSGTSIARGSDGWQLWRILRNKPASLAPDEIIRLRGKVGLAAIQRHARLTRIIKYIMGSFLVVTGLGVGAFIIPVARFIYTPGDDTYNLIGALCIVGVMGIVCLVSLTLGFLLLRKAKREFAPPEAKIKYSPLREQMMQYRLMILHQFEKWKLNELPEDVRLKIISPPEDIKIIPFLEEIGKKWPTTPLINLMLHDSYMDERRYNEAEKEIAKVLERDDLPEPVRFHFETCLLAAQLGASADDVTIARCEAAIDSISDDGLRMWRSIDFASTIITAKHAHRIDQAIKWCELAREIYPYDAAVFLLSAVISIEKNDTKSAKADLKSAKEIADETNIARIRAYLAIVAALDNDPKAAKLLDQSLSVPLPLSLKQRLEEARQNLSSSLPNGG